MKTKMKIDSPNGLLSAVLEVPDGKDTCPLVILMHGFMANKKLEPLKSVAALLLEKGIAALRFDFDGHGRSQGRFRDMTVLTELSDAKAVYDAARKLPFVSDIAFLGHSQGGVVAGMLAGELGCPAVKALVQLAPAAVLKDDALNGVPAGEAAGVFPYGGKELFHCGPEASHLRNLGPVYRSRPADPWEGGQDSPLLVQRKVSERLSGQHPPAPGRGEPYPLQAPERGDPDVRAVFNR